MRPNSRGASGPYNLLHEASNMFVLASCTIRGTTITTRQHEESDTHWFAIYLRISLSDLLIVMTGLRREHWCGDSDGAWSDFQRSKVFHVIISKFTLFTLPMRETSTITTRLCGESSTHGFAIYLGISLSDLLIVKIGLRHEHWCFDSRWCMERLPTVQSFSHPHF